MTNFLFPSIPEAVCFGDTFVNPHPLDTRERDEAFQGVSDPDFKLHKGLQCKSQRVCAEDKKRLEISGMRA